MIALSEYKRIVSLMPILCVDLVLRDRNGQFLLGRRTNEPLKGEWWVIGGRVQKGETAQVAARRKLREELGVEVGRLQLLGLYEDFFEQNSLGIESEYHTVSIVFEAILETTAVRLDGQHTEWKLSNELPARLIIQPFRSEDDSASERARGSQVQGAS